MEYSVIIPVYNEEESLSKLFDELYTAFDNLQKPYEIILVNDCSSDRSLSMMKEFQDNSGKVVRIVNLPQRSGQTLALRKGLEAVHGKIGIMLDADLQNDPADIPKLLKKMEQGYDMVCGWRKNRLDTPLKVGLSKLGNIWQRLLSGLKIHDISCTLRVFKRECIGHIALNWEGQHRFIPLSLYLHGYSIGEVVSNHRKRQFGQSKYSHKRIFKVIVDFFKVLKSRGKKWNFG